MPLQTRASHVVCLSEDKKFKMKKGHNSEKLHFELSALKVLVAL